MTDNTKIEPTWPRGMYGCPQDMYGASVVLPLIAERDAAAQRITHLEGQLSAARNVYPSIREAVAERDALAAVIAKITERWWQGAEMGDNGMYFYNDPEDTLDDICQILAVTPDDAVPDLPGFEGTQEALDGLTIQPKEEER